MPNDRASDEIDLKSETLKDDKSNASEESAGTEAETRKLKIGEREYSADELATLVEKAESVSTIEKDQNISIKELYPDYVKKSQLLKGYEQKQKEEVLPVGGTPGPEDAAEKRAVDTLRSKYGFFSKEDKESFKQELIEEVKTNQLLEDLEDVKKDFPGVDKREVLDFMQATRVSDPFVAAEKLANYKKMNQEKSQPKAVFTERSGSSGVHTPKGKDIPSLEKTADMSEYIREELEQSRRSPLEE